MLRIEQKQISDNTTMYSIDCFYVGALQKRHKNVDIALILYTYK